jgi:hypothetical protein
MADYSNYPAYRAAVEKVQKLQLKLSGSKGSRATGLEEAMANIAAQKGRDSKEFIDIKTRFDALQEEIKQAKADATAMRIKIDAEDVAKETEKNKAAFNKTLTRLETERDTFKDRNDKENADFKQAEIDAFKKSTTPEQQPAEENPDNPYGNYTLGTDGKVYGPGADNQNGLEGVFVPIKDSKGELVNEFTTNSGSLAVKKFLTNYTKPGQIAALQKQLLDSDYITQNDIAGDTWTAGVLDMLKAYSRDYISKTQFEGAKDVPTIDVFMQSKRVGSTGSSKSYRTVTKRGDAKKKLDEYMVDLVGRASTPEEEEAYYKKLRAAEQKAVLTVSNGVQTGEQLDEADRILIAVDVAKKSLKGTDVEKLLASGGRAAIDIAALQEYSADYGIEMSAADALKYVATGLGQKDYIPKQQERIRQTAITLNPQLKEHFAAGGTYKDIADQYRVAKQRKLGVTITDSNKDKDITDAISKGVSINDFNTQLQGKAEWRKTPEANSIVDGFINKLGEMWGLG